MRIGYLLQQGTDIRRPPFDGPGVHVREVARELTYLGHEVTVILQLGREIWRTDDLEHFAPVPVPNMDAGPRRKLESAIRRLQSELQLPYAALFESMRFAAACVGELPDSDLLYERTSWVSYGGALAARRLGVPLVLENNGDHLADLEAKGIAPRGAQRRLSIALMGRAIRQAAHVVVSGDGWRDAFIQRWTIAPERVTTVENGTTLVRLLPHSALGSFEAPAGSSMPVRLVYLGGFQPWQGVEILLRALAGEARLAHTRLTLIGPTEGLGVGAQQMAAALGLLPRVTFTGALDAESYAPILAHSDIGLAPYCGWPEYSGLKLLDYKAAGLAVIASGRDGRPACLDHGRTGWIVPPCDETALAEALVQLVQDPQLRRQLGQNARIEAEAYHGWDATARRLDAIFRDVEQSHARAGMRGKAHAAPASASRT
jgi:glycosyltransferase involved in cell wall biosynthesis